MASDPRLPEPPYHEVGDYTAIATMPYLRRDDPSMLCALGVVPATAPIGATTMEAMGHDRRPGWTARSGGYRRSWTARRPVPTHRPQLRIGSYLPIRRP
ncbi:MAG TPA: hypothetical protein VF060_19710 [Trebonia sp.]